MKLFLSVLLTMTIIMCSFSATYAVNPLDSSSKLQQSQLQDEPSFANKTFDAIKYRLQRGWQITKNTAIYVGLVPIMGTLALVQCLMGDKTTKFDAMIIRKFFETNPLKMILRK